MARIRTIKPGFFKHGDLFDAERESGLPLRIAYAGLWTVADREGRFKWKPRDIKVDVLPYDNLNMSDVMEALETRGFIQRYTVDGHDFGCIPAFLEHQHVNKNEAQSTIPAPPKNSNARANTRRAPKQNHEERKGKEGKENISDDESADPFHAFWKAYPRREAKGNAERSFAAALTIASPDVLVAAASAYAAKRSGEDAKFTKLPATWLNQKCWLDDGLSPKPQEDATAEKLAWGGRASPLVDEIGAAKFRAWFGEAEFVPGPPVLLRFRKPFQRQYVGTHFSTVLARVFHEFELEVAA